MEDIIDIIVTETTNLIEITSQPTDEIIDVNIIDNREDITLNVTPTVVEININSLTGNFGVNWGDIEGTLSNQTDLQTVLNAKADLVDGKVPSSQLPSYVDDVVEVATYSALPVTGETGKIYITLDTNYIYRWTGSTYVEIKDSSAVWGAITGTLSNQTDLQNALNLKANDSLVVHLAGTETITGAKTFSSAVTAPNFVLSGGTGNTGLYYGHTDRVVLANYTVGGIDFEVNGGSIVATLFPSGNYGLGITLDAGYKLDVNGTARISGVLSGTSASFSSSITASSLIKSGGTSSQFLKADGSVDSNTYLTTSSAASTYVSGSGITDYYAKFTGTKVIADGFIRTTSNITYVEGMGLSTGNGLDIQGNYGAGGGGLKIRSYDETTGNAYIDFANTGGRMYLGLNRSTSGGLMTNATSYATVLTTGLGTTNLEFGTNATKRLTIDGTTGAVTATSSVTASALYVTGMTAGNGAIYYNSGANRVTVANYNASGIVVFEVNGGASALTLNANLSATFASTLSATGATLTGALNGTSASFNSTLTTTGGTRSIQLVSFASDYNYIRSNGAQLVVGTQDSQDLFIQTNNTTRLTLVGSTGAATFSSSVTVASTMQSNYVNIQAGGNAEVANINSTNANGGYLTWQTSGSVIADIGTLQQIFGSGGSTNFGINARGARDLAFGTNNTERLRITSSGNVGIGTTSPSDYSIGSTAKVLQVTGSAYGIVNANAGSVYAWLIADTAAAATGTQSNHDFKIVTNNTERMRIKSNGIINFSNVPTSSAGLSSGDVYKTVAGVLMIV